MRGDVAFDLPLNLSGGTPVVESRSGGTNGEHQIVISFATPISMSDASVSAGQGQISNYNVDGSKAIVNLSGVPNGQTVGITLHNVNDGARTGAVSVAFSALLGDVNGNGTVTASDVAQVKSRAGEAADETNFRADVVPNGSINASDISLVKIPIRQQPNDQSHAN